MKLSEIMTRNVEYVAPSQSLREAAQKMQRFDVGPMPVCLDGRVVGILTDRDITVRAVAQGRNPETTLVNEVMSPNVSYCAADDDIKVAAKIMSDRQLRRIVVLDENSHLAGIVSLGDLAMNANDPKLVGHVVETVSQPGRGPA